MNIKKEPLLPERIRKIEKGFGFIPNRFLTGGSSTTSASMKS